MTTQAGEFRGWLVGWLVEGRGVEGGDGGDGGKRKKTKKLFCLLFHVVYFIPSFAPSSTLKDETKTGKEIQRKI